MADEDRMAHVNVTINGRQFRMACEDGQEDHLRDLAQDFDRRIGDLRTKFGEIGDTRLTVMAALTVADELAAAGRRIRDLQEEAAALQNAGAIASDRATTTETAVVSALNSAADRIEWLTRQLHQTVGHNNGGMAVG